MRKLIRKFIFEELESAFGSDGKINFDSDEGLDTEEIENSLEQDVEGMEDMVKNQKKTISFPTSTDPSIASKEKRVKMDKIDDLNDRIDKKKEDIEKMKGIKTGMQQMSDAMNANQEDQEDREEQEG
jgi:hypothetical protein|tara:strand:- start:11361 stop:11741 length:381 start_codon:yes stop_codon:yes gene_type:complete